ncbi:unnamed protein product [Cunninghamella blakesleeana]
MDALHWASHRGNDDIVRLLLSNGADITVKTNKGQTALDLCDKHPNVKAMLEAQHVETTDVGPEPELPIKATYLKEPDLEKSWLLPDEFSENKADRIIRQQTALDNLNNEKNNTNQQQPVKNTESSYNTSNISTKDIDENEILVYLKTKSDDAILGSVYLKNEPLNNIIQSLKNELDDLPENFTIARNNGKLTIPINSKQMSKNLLDIFRGDDDVLIIVPASS